MNILMINKFLYPRGGAETYILKLGSYLQNQGHEVQYFGMEHEGNVVGNRVGAYTSTMDFHGGSLLSKLRYPLKTIYSAEARRKLRLVLDDVQPDVCHLNNFHYQLTPAVILEIRRWSKATGHPCKIIYTAHDYQLICPNHMCHNPNTHENCEKCLGGRFINCVKGKCIHGSWAKSVIGALEATLWNRLGVYREIDTILCCSEFMKTMLDTNPVLAEKTVVMHNFVDRAERKKTVKGDYVLYFGRYCEEKGLGTLIKAARQLPQVQFVFAGAGPLEDRLTDIPNIRNVGFQRGQALERLIREARFTLCPSEWYENCPFSVMESLMYQTPVIAADIGGISELIQTGRTGELFESGNAEALRQCIERMWTDGERAQAYAANCGELAFDDIAQYGEKLMKYYGKSEGI